jgi:hypothetical protein
MAAAAAAAAPGKVERDQYEHVLVVDRSGSMNTKGDTTGQMTRWEYALECSQAFVAQCVKRQGRPMKLLFFSSDVIKFDGVTSDKLPELWKKYQPSGSTNMAKAVQTAVDDFFAARASGKGPKRLLLVVITDGEPDSREAVAKCIVDATHKIEEDAELGMQFIQIGRDKGASKFLQWLDVGLVEPRADEPDHAAREQLRKEVKIRLPRYAKFDVLDATPAEEVDEKGGLNKVLDMAITD